MSRALNPRGIAQFFTFGQLLGEDTFYESIEVLPAAGWLDLRARLRSALGGPVLAARRRSRGGTGSTGARPSIASTTAFGRAVERCVGGGERLGLSLSGGHGLPDDARRDRHRRHTPSPRSASAWPGSIDIRSAEQMARLAGIPHHRYQLDRARSWSGSRSTSAGWCT